MYIAYDLVYSEVIGRSKSLKSLEKSIASYLQSFFEDSNGDQVIIFRQDTSLKVKYNLGIVSIKEK